MGLKLNTISDKTAYDNLEYARASLFRGSDDFQIHPVEAKAKAFFRMATNLYKLETQTTDIAQYFRQCGEAYLASYELAGLPRHRDVNLLIQRVFPCLYCFSASSDIERLIQMDEWHYCWPPMPDISISTNSEIPYAAYSHVLTYMRELKRVFSGKPIQVELCHEAIGKLDLLKGVNRAWSSDETSLGLKILVAIDQRDQSLLETEIKNLITLHRRRAHRGDLKRDDAGLISMHGLLLAKIALQAGVSIDVKSRYLPFALLAEA